MSFWGWALLAVVLLAWLAVRRGLPGRAAAQLVERRLGGYRHLVQAVDEARPTKVEGREVRVAVIGGGLAGIAAASTLGERGAKVTLFERNPYLGGKIGAWKVSIAGSEQTIEHGFHAFFRQYYNLNRFLDRLGLRQSFAQIEDYLILDAEHRPLSFGEVATTPGINIVDLGRRGFYRWRDVVRKNTRDRLNAFVRFNMEHTYRELDETSFARFCDEAELPHDLRVAFRTFARAFFADETELSTADVVRAFHFYYLGHDEGLMYDYPAGDYEATLLAPIRAHLRAHDVDLRLDHPVQGVQRGTNKRFRVEGDDFDWVVIAADIPGAQAIVEESPWLESEQPGLVSDIRALRTSNGYAVWRIWVDADVRAGLPTFVNVDRKRVLDSVTLYHRITNEARAWVQTHGGAVLELHSYALPGDLTDEAEVRRIFLKELHFYFPELEGMTIAAEALQVRRDFPAFAPGQRAHRPEPELPVDGLLLAGDWVRLPYPMTHMEAAFTSGVIAANHILAGLGVRQEPIYSVAPRGLFTSGRR